MSETTGDYSDLSGSEFGSDQVTWIEWFCHLKGNEFFVEVDDDYVQDDFNLTYLSKELAEHYGQDLYRDALNMILDYDENNDSDRESEKPLVDQAAQCLYGLIHARFILTVRGMASMFEKYNSYVYGSCPLLDCHAQNQAVLPIGLSDTLGRSGTKIYCPRCKEIFNPKSSKLEVLDGAFFGTSFPHLFFLTYPHLKPSSDARTYVPRIFGFKVSQQMKGAACLAESAKEAERAAAEEEKNRGNQGPSLENRTIIGSGYDK